MASHVLGRRNIGHLFGNQTEKSKSTVLGLFDERCFNLQRADLQVRIRENSESCGQAEVL
jgi:hypothetical protein